MSGIPDRVASPKVCPRNARIRPIDILPRLKGGGFQLLRRLEEEVRFAVHGPGYAVASPRSHGDEPVPGHTNTLSDTADISGEVKRRFLPGLKAGVSTPRS